MAIVSHKIALDVEDYHRSWFSQQCGYASAVSSLTL